MKTDIIDIHTHNLHSDAINNCRVGEYMCELKAGFLYSVGLHPWDVDGFWQKKLELLERVSMEPEVVMIGECGLDRVRGGDFDLQVKVFEKQIVIALSVNKPLILHCVKSFGELLGITKKYGELSGIVIHGFNANEKILNDLLKQDFYISVGKYVLNDNSNISKLISYIPKERLLIESDEFVDLHSIYARSAFLLGVNENQLISQVSGNIAVLLNL